MSADEVFAAQMWAWPGPMLKRDAQGRVLIVNASFLQLYGGRVEDWHGNAVTGWPAPQPPGQSTRFESRMPLQDGSEIVYDWIECSMADGTALAIARDVSAFVNTPQAAPVHTPPPVETAAPPAAETPAETHYAAAEQGAPPPAEVPATSSLIQDAEAAVAQAEAPMEPASIPAEPPLATETESSVDDLLDTSPPEPAAASDERAYERRALPIEDGDAVLGNNWRDAVIAKAIGAEDAEEGSAPDSAGEAVQQSAEPKQTDGVRILLAEDNAINALLTRTLLEAEGCVVDVVEDGSLAVEAMKNAPYDMIFMDMRMPNMDGLEATRKIRSMDHLSKGLPIVALTANAFDDDRNACFDSGMNDFMTKPVSAEELSQMVKIHAGKKEDVAA